MDWHTQLGPEHREMAELVGTWTATMTMWMDPSVPPQRSEGTAVRRLILGGHVMEEVMTITVMGQAYEGRGLSGYDTITKRHWGIWTDNMGTGVTISYGGWNDAKDLFVLEGESSNPMEGKVIAMRIESRMDGADREVDTFFNPGPDGAMIRTMEIIYERQA